MVPLRLKSWCVCVPDSAQNHRDISLLHGKRKEAAKEEREKAHSPLRRACSTPVSTVSWKIGHDMIQRYHFWDHFLGLFSGAIFWEHFLGPFSGAIFLDHLLGPLSRTFFWDHFLGPFSGTIFFGRIHSWTIFGDHLLGPSSGTCTNEVARVFTLPGLFYDQFLDHCEGFSSG